MGKWSQRFGGVRVALSLVLAAATVFWVVLKSALRMGRETNDARRRADEDFDAVLRAEKEGDADWIKKDILRRAKRRNGDGT